MTGASVARLEVLTPVEALRLLSASDRGQFVYIHGAVTVVRPASHLVESGDLIVRTPIPADRFSHDPGGPPTVATYHVSEVDRSDGSGWQVTATGVAHPINDPMRISRYRRTMAGWTLAGYDLIIRVRLQLFDAYRIEPARAGGARHD